MPLTHPNTPLGRLPKPLRTLLLVPPHAFLEPAHFGLRRRRQRRRTPPVSAKALCRRQAIAVREHKHQRRPRRARLHAVQPSAGDGIKIGIGTAMRGDDQKKERACRQVGL
eukprot:4359766-Pleurochrysis_carterae.AAC.1